MSIKWNIRMAMAKKGIWTGAELQRQLAEKAGLNISKAGISRLLKDEQSEIKLKVLDALCTVLECQISDLIITSFEAGEAVKSKDNKIG